ncbi:hemicentin-1-like [Ornithodoros turicata]|uniref:hemicentin-1-like n=1 Tax=Ornithodoros turicata TaxID=34597 RepID=UPI0031396EA3
MWDRMCKSDLWYCLGLCLFWVQLLRTGAASHEASSSPTSRSLNPLFLSSIQTILATTNDDVTLTCLVGNLGSHKVTWYRVEGGELLTSDTTVLTSDPRVESLHPRPSEWLLVVRRVRPDDSGVYACAVDTLPWLTQLGSLEVHHRSGNRHHGSHQRIVNLQGKKGRIRRRPKRRRHRYVQETQDSKDVAVKKGEPYFAETIPSLTVAAGRNAVLKCVVESLGNYTVAWLNVDKQTLLALHTHVIVQNERIRVSHSAHRTWQLEIRDVRPEDTGYYMCQINTRPMKTQVGYLNVVVAPYFVDAFTTRNLTARENSNVSFRCEARGNPQPKVTWRREDAQPFRIDDDRVTVYRGEVLRFPRVSRSHMGTYLCLASNGVPPSVSRRILLEVSFPPMIWVPNQVVGAPIGTSVVLECHTEAHPASENFWFRDGRRLEAFAPMEETTEEGRHSGRRKKLKKHEATVSKTGLKVYMKLTLWNLKHEDYGTYHCIAQNALGRTEGKVQLHEISSSSGRTDPPVEMSTGTSSSANDVDERALWEPPTKAKIAGDVQKGGEGGRAVKHFQDFRENRFEYESSHHPTTVTDKNAGDQRLHLCHHHRWRVIAVVTIVLLLRW